MPGQESWKASRLDWAQFEILRCPSRGMRAGSVTLTIQHNLCALLQMTFGQKFTQVLKAMGASKPMSHPCRTHRWAVLGSEPVGFRVRQRVDAGANALAPQHAHAVFPHGHTPLKLGHTPALHADNQEIACELTYHSGRHLQACA